MAHKKKNKNKIVAKPQMTSSPIPDSLLQQVKSDLAKTVVLSCTLFVLEFAIFFVTVNGIDLSKFLRM